MSVTERRQITAFVLVGLVGFLVDAAALQTALSVFHQAPIPARLYAFVPAVLVTWLLHRRFTFAQRRSDKRTLELGKYLGSQAFSWAVGFAVYSALVLSIAFFHRLPLAALAIQSAVGATCNYLLSHYLVFTNER
ncbi:MAG: GtrA family protein [Pseudomonadota bacterium]